MGELANDVVGDNDNNDGLQLLAPLLFVPEEMLVEVISHSIFLLEQAAAANEENDENAQA